MEHPSTLESLALHAFLDFLEAECQMLVAMVMRDSPYWKKTREALLESMKRMVNQTLVGGGGYSNASSIRLKLFESVVSGKVPYSTPF